MTNHEMAAEQSLGGAELIPADRSNFIKKTYLHLLAAICGFAAVEYAIFAAGLAEPIFAFVMQISWLAVLGAFVIVSWMASHIAHRVESKPMQYAALAGFVVAEALIFVPMMVLAMAVAPGIIEQAAVFTLVAFAGLTAVAILSGRDFSFLRGLLMWGGLIALGTIVMGTLMGFDLGTWFSMGMIGFAGASILYDTSKILRTYPDDRYVAAALELFASVALMLWYVLRLLMRR